MSAERPAPAAYAALRERLRQCPTRWLITGVAGFIGSNLLEALLELDQEVVGLDNLSLGKRANLEQVRSAAPARRWARFTFIEGDIRSLTTCQRASHGADYVLHQAAIGSVPRSLADPLASHDNNVNGQLNVLLAARDAGVRRCVYASSSSVYGDSPVLPKREDQIGQPLSPYAATKRINEIYAAVVARAYGVSVIGLRYFNVFGPRQDPDGAYAAVIPRWIGAMIRAQPVYLNGDGETSRDFCYVDNVVQANLLAACSTGVEAESEVFNIAAGGRTTLSTLFEALRQRLEAAFPYLGRLRPIQRPTRPGDVPHSHADISKAASVLGYCPSHSLEQGLDASLGWYRRELGPPRREMAQERAVWAGT